MEGRNNEIPPPRFSERIVPHVVMNNSRNDSENQLSLPPPPPPPPSEGNIQFAIVSSLLENEEKNYQDVRDLKRSGVSLDIIARVKGVSMVELISFMHYKSIPFDTPHGNFVNPTTRDLSPLLPPVAKKGRNGRRKKSWKIEDFPTVKPADDYYCADCKKERSCYSCPCGRKCWKYCENCHRFFSNHHKCFKKMSKKRRRVWKENEFPQQNIGKYYCGDCKIVCTRRTCSCKRECWEWCESCIRYYPKNHFKSHSGDENIIEDEESSLLDCVSSIPSPITSIPPPLPPISQGNSGSSDLTICEPLASLIHENQSRGIVLKEIEGELLAHEGFVTENLGDGGNVCELIYEEPPRKKRKLE